MFEQLRQIGFELSRLIVRKALTRHDFLAIRILSRCLPSLPIYRLPPLAYSLSATLSLAVATVILTCLAIFALNVGWWISAIFLFAAFIFRYKLREFGFSVVVVIIGMLVLIPNPDIGIAVRLGIFVISCMIGLASRWEKRAEMKQFLFKPLTLNNINHGSATILKDEVHVVNLFVNTNHHQQWKLKERRVVRSRATHALNWLVSQAERYNVNLCFVEHSINSHPKWYNSIPDSRSDQSEHREFGDWLFDSMTEFLEGHSETRSPNQSIIPGSNVCFLVHVKEQLRSYAVPQCMFLTPTCNLEYAVIASPHQTSTIAHELLHLFGADDFYLEAYWGDNCNDSALRMQLLDRCIMFKTAADVSDLRVDDLTAQNVGWL